MKLVVGLGNPGNEYSKTRHNIGFQLLDYIASRNNIQFKGDKKFNFESPYIDSNGTGSKCNSYTANNCR